MQNYVNFGRKVFWKVVLKIWLEQFGGIIVELFKFAWEKWFARFGRKIKWTNLAGKLC